MYTDTMPQAHMCTYRNTDTHVYIQVYACVCVQMSMCAYAVYLRHMNMYTQVHTRMNVHTHIHTPQTIRSSHQLLLFTIQIHSSYKYLTYPKKQSEGTLCHR